jgi:hypothetical protein
MKGICLVVSAMQRIHSASLSPSFQRSWSLRCLSSSPFRSLLSSTFFPPRQCRLIHRRLHSRRNTFYLALSLCTLIVSTLFEITIILCSKILSIRTFHSLYKDPFEEASFILCTTTPQVQPSSCFSLLSSSSTRHPQLASMAWTCLRSAPSLPKARSRSEPLATAP